ncbi:MAG: penicillin acylase family protein [Acidimicrobiia bacterium]
MAMRGRVGTVVAASVLLAAVVNSFTPASAASKGAASKGAASKRASCTGEQVGSGEQAARICRDARYGIPSIWAKRMPGVWFGTGWAQAEDRLAQLELVRRNARGSLAELFGAFDASTIDQDKETLTNYYSDAELQRQFESLNPAMRDAITDFVAGVNAYVEKAYATPESQAKLVPNQFFTIGKLRNEAVYRPAPFTPLDVVANGNFLSREFGGGGGDELSNLAFLQFLQGKYGKDAGYAIFNDARWVNDPTAPTTVPDGRPKYGYGRAAAGGRHDPPAATVAAAAAARDRHRDLLESIGTRYHVPWRDGSNAWVVAPKKTTNGHTFLWGGPQEGFDTPNIDWEVYQHGPGFDAGGMTIALAPVILIGRNADLAFTTTSEETVNQQVYQETVDFSKNPPTYRYRGRDVPMQVVSHTLKVAGKPDETFVSYRTVHGPVIKTDGANHVAYAIKYASFGKEWKSFQGFSEQSTAHSLAQYRTAMSHVATLHNFFVADRHGNIAYYGTGLVPVLEACPGLTKPQPCDPRLPHPGDGSQEWLGTVPFSRMPHVVNPKQGYIANWNTKPSAQHYQQQNGGDEYWGTIYRSESIVRRLQEKAKLSPAELTAIEADVGTIDDDNTRPAAPYFLPKLFAAYDRLPATHTAQTDQAVAALKAWNRRDTIGNAAMSIHTQWIHALGQRVYGANGIVPFAGTGEGQDFTRQGSYNLLWHALSGTRGLVPCGRLCSTTDYFGGKPDEVLVQSLQDALITLAGTGELPGTHGAHGFGTTDVSKWGWVAFHDKAWNDLDPVANAAADLGLLQKPDLGTSATQNRSTWMQAMDLSPKGIAGVAVFAPGESGFIAKDGTFDPHFADQVQLFNDFRYKPMPDPTG